MKEFKINKYISLRLEKADTIIYVDGNRFNVCKTLILNIPFEKITSFNNIESVDEAVEKLKTEENNQSGGKYGISSEEEFWGHCSNLQVWVENDYNTRLLRYNLAFPLLKRLTRLGDPIAKKVFKEEICTRLETGAFTNGMITFFIEQGGYIDYLEDDEIETLVENIFLRGKFFTTLRKIDTGISDQLLRKLKIEENLMNNLINCKSKQLGDALICLSNYCFLKRNELRTLLSELICNTNSFNNIIKLIKILINKEDWINFYEIRRYIIEASKNMDDLLRNNIIKKIEEGGLENLNAILKMRWLEYFEPAELNSLFMNSKVGLSETLYRNKYWISKQKIPINFIYKDDHGNLQVELHSNLAFPILSKLITNGHTWASSVLLKCINEIFNQNDIPAILHLLDSINYFEKEITDLISMLSFDACKSILKGIIQSHDIIYDSPLSSYNIKQFLSSNEHFKKNILKLYNLDKKYFSNEEWIKIKKIFF